MALIIMRSGSLCWCVTLSDDDGDFAVSIRGHSNRNSDFNRLEFVRIRIWPLGKPSLSFVSQCKSAPSERFKSLAKLFAQKPIGLFWTKNEQISWSLSQFLSLYKSSEKRGYFVTFDSGVWLGVPAKYAIPKWIYPLVRTFASTRPSAW